MDKLTNFKNPGMIKYSIYLKLSTLCCKVETKAAYVVRLSPVPQLSVLFHKTSKNTNSCGCQQKTLYI